MNDFILSYHVCAIVRIELGSWRIQNDSTIGLCQIVMPQLYIDYWELEIQEIPYFHAQNSCNRKKRSMAEKDSGLIYMYKTTVLALLIFIFIFFPFSFPKDCKSSMCGNFVSMPNSYLPLSPFTQKVWGVVACVGQHINYNIYSKKRRKLAWPFEEYEHFECLFGWALLYFLNAYKGFNAPPSKKNEISGAICFSNSLFPCVRNDFWIVFFEYLHIL